MLLLLLLRIRIKNTTLHLDEIVKRDGYLERVVLEDDEDEDESETSFEVLDNRARVHASVRGGGKGGGQSSLRYKRPGKFLEREKAETLTREERRGSETDRRVRAGARPIETSSGEVFCRVTGKYVPKIEKLVVEHCSGKRFTVGEAKVVGKKQTLLEEGDPREEEEAKEKRKRRIDGWRRS